MSRHVLPLSAATTASNIATELAVGWDPPLATFFFQLLHEDDEGEPISIIWIGTTYGEVRDVDKVAELAARYSDATNVRELLLADQAAQGSRAKQPWSL